MMNDEICPFQVGSSNSNDDDNNNNTSNNNNNNNNKDSLTSCWQVTTDHGFLLATAPLKDLRSVPTGLDSDHVDCIEEAAQNLPRIIETGRTREVLGSLPLMDLTPTLLVDGPCKSALVASRILERLFVIYTYFVNAYVHMGGGTHDDDADNPHGSTHPPPFQRIPPCIAVPAAWLADQLGRPPVVSYVSNVLSNWKCIQDTHDGVHNTGLNLENLRLLQTFTSLYDEQWFFLVHATIEARAGRLLMALPRALQAVNENDPQLVASCLEQVQQGLTDITKLLNRIPDHCDAKKFYHHVRYPLFGITNVIFEGVERFHNEPQSFLGGSGAQSCILPAVLAGLGVQHSSTTDLSIYLSRLRSYMPQPHQDFVAQLQGHHLRSFCAQPANHNLQAAYNGCLQQVITFRKTHFYYARKFVFAQSSDPVGTGGTIFMTALDELIQETRDQFLA